METKQEEIVIAKLKEERLHTKYMKKKIIKKINIIFDEWRLEITTGVKDQINFCGLPIMYWEEKGEANIDLQNFLISLIERYKKHENKN